MTFEKFRIFTWMSFDKYQTVALLILLGGGTFSTGSAHAATDPAKASDRIIFVGSEMVGLFSTCKPSEEGDIYIASDFFKSVRLKKQADIIQCEGRDYYKPVAAFAKSNLLGTLTINADKSDYDTTISEYAEPRVIDPEGGDLKLPLKFTRALVLQHSASVWWDLSGIDLTLGLNARQYTEDDGLFVLDGYASSSAGRTSGHIANLGWREHYPDQGFDARFGVNSLALSGSSMRSYGLVLNSDDQVIQKNSTQALEGFSEVPGKLVIRANAVIVKEVSIAAGFFSVPMGGTAAVPGANGQYQLSIVNDSGQVLRTWTVFVPLSAQLLKAKRATWKFFAGSIQGLNSSASHLLPGRFDLGLGGVYRYGLMEKLTTEVSGFVAQHTSGLGASFVAVPTPFASLSGGFLKARDELSTVNSYAALDLHSGNFGSNLGYTRLNCTQASNPANPVNSVVINVSCRALNAHVYYNSPHFGRLILLSNRAIDGSPMGSSRGFNYTFPNLGRFSLSVYGNRQNYLGSSSYSVGLQASMPLDGGQLMMSLSKGSSGIATSSTTYNAPAIEGQQYTMAADVTPGQPSSTGLRLNASMNRWDGSYQANARMDRTGAVTLGAAKSGAVVFSNGQVLRSSISDDSYSLIRLKGLPNVKLEGAGRTQGHTNEEGFAVVPSTPNSVSSLSVNPTEVADNLLVAEPLVGKTSVRWKASYWEPSVRKVIKGWIRLRLNKERSVPLGSVFRLPGNDTLVVLDHGDVFVPDMPSTAQKVLVYLPGSSARCEAQLPAGVQLSSDYNQEKPEIECVLATAAAEREKEIARGTRR